MSTKKINKTKWNGDLDIGSIYMCMLLSILKWCINIYNSEFGELT